MEQWCKRCARWTENPEVLVQLKAAPQIMTIWSSGRRQQTANLIGRNSTREFESLYSHIRRDSSVGRVDASYALGRWFDPNSRYKRS